MTVGKIQDGNILQYADAQDRRVHDRRRFDADQFQKNNTDKEDAVAFYMEAMKYNKADSWFYLFSKRLMDIVVSGIALFFIWPIILWISIYIRVKSKNKNTIYKQMRIKKDRRDFFDTLNEKKQSREFNNPIPGFFYSKKYKTLKKDKRQFNYYGQPFRFYKFQTMYPDARERFPELYKYKYDDKAIKEIKFKIKDDPRVPEWAGWLRKSSLDELPNFVNVFLGDMSLIGPRPDIMEMIQYYKSDQLLKLSIKPGVTGYAQVMGRGDLSFQDTLKWDLEYVINRNLWLDITLLLKTVYSCVVRRGAF